MPRVAFITDQHICAATRWDEAQRIMQWCVQECAAQRPDVIALGGDLFDRAPNVIELRVVAEWLVQLADLAPVVGVAGNHDPLGLTVLNMLESRHPIRLVDVPTTVQVGDIELVLLPWPRKAQLLALLGDVGKEAARQVGVELLLDVLRGMGMESDDTFPRCFVGHVQLRGAKVSTGQPLAPGADFELGLHDLTLARCDAYLLGHIHLPDDMQVDGAPVSYGGSFRRTAFGEVEEKSLVLLDLDLREVKRSRVPIPCTPMVLIEGQWASEHVGLPGDRVVPAGLMFDGDLPDVSGAEVRLRYLVEADHRDAAKAGAAAFCEQLRAQGAVDIKVEPEVVATTRARAPEVAAAKTLREKVVALWNARDCMPDDRRRDRLLSKVDDLENAS